VIRIPALTRRWRPEDGDAHIVEGIVVRMPEPGAPAGNYILLRQGSGCELSIAATARRGHTVLERELERQRVRVGDRLRVEFRGWAGGLDAPGHMYRLYAVEVDR